MMWKGLLTTAVIRCKQNWNQHMKLVTSEWNT